VAADFPGVGELGECQLSTAWGTSGSTTPEEGRTTVSAKGEGEGDAIVEEVRGVARLQSEKGTIRISRVHADMEARTTTGDIDVGEVVRGSVVATTTFASIGVGVAVKSGARPSLDSTAVTVHRPLSPLEACEQTTRSCGSRPGPWWAPLW
jgi:hypothetical protein